MNKHNLSRLRSAALAALAAVTVANSMLLGGCAAVVVGGAAVGTAMVATDRRTSGTQLEDQNIELKALTRISETVGDRGHVNVTSYNRMVLADRRGRQRGRPHGPRTGASGASRTCVRSSTNWLSWDRVRSRRAPTTPS